MGVVIAVVVTLASVVLFAAATPVGRGQKAGRRGAGWLALLAAAPVQTLGLALLYGFAGRAPGSWVDGALVAGCVVGWVGVALCLRLDRPAVRSALAAVAAVTGTLVVAAASLRTDAPLDLPFAPLHVPVAVVATGLVLAAGAVAARRLQRSRLGGAGVLAAGLLLATAVAGLPWGPGGERTFGVVDEVGAPVVARVTLALRDGGGAYDRDLQAAVSLPDVEAAREVVAWVSALAAVLLVVHVFVPGVVFRGAAVIGVGGASLALAALLVLLAFRLLVGTAAPVNEGELYAWLRQAVLPQLTDAVEVRAVRLPDGGTMRLSLASQPAAWGALLAVGVLALGSAAAWLRRQFGPAAEADDVLSATWLERAELRLVLWGLVALAGTLLTGGLWAELRFGSLTPADPRAVTAVVSFGLLALALLAQRLLPAQRELPSWLVLLAAIVCVAGLVGPELGWTLPSAHGFVRL